MGVTMEYIARMANVSKATVSRVVNGKTEGGRQGRPESGFSALSRNMATRPIWWPVAWQLPTSKTIGLVIPNITNPFFPDLIRSLQIPLQAYGYTVML